MNDDEDFLTAMLVENVVLMRFRALPLHRHVYRCQKSTGMGVAVMFVTVLATAVTYPI